ncbi:formate dehydrogenase accessory sulfurtransferase FdhD [Mesobacillus maritimus]|uniref:formate dehydrogenase accessory sulfurtransferase FdhD n=1 Tax=Mesobacillus maritimus TaxID=1643336 RepID=UPI00203CE5E6|nr:formate dehydrogenase accessory sulfurtransferase FdhD [Mesobacillus maritimus]MCM3586808.1 formate dehydrogenase accessory sulfurtransferase FdhD [Mesobacillus maritimus]MCM3668837.1 formate dehydrogenase accessory sulfurtransferase FdhD [Mesobacillus maritimus]
MLKKGCPDEYPINLVVNGFEIAVFQLTSQDLVDWAYGYLFSEGLIDRAEDIDAVNFQEGTGTLHVSLNNDFDPKHMFSKKKHYTAGCGRGVTFFSMTDVKSFQKVKSNEQYALSYLLKKRSEFAQNSPLYLETGGMHGACIIHEDGEIVVREDIGRHNAVDKVIGHAIRKRLQPERLVLLTTGRVSYEMLSKAAKFGFPVIGSRTAATKQAVQLARFLQIEVVGYLRGKMANVYTSTGRIYDDVTGSTVAEKPIERGEVSLFSINRTNRD